MPDFSAFNKPKKNTLDELIDKENEIHDQQKQKSTKPKINMPMPKKKTSEAKEPTYLMLKNKAKLKRLADEADISMAELVDFWIENA